MLDLSCLRAAVAYEGGVSRRLFLALGAALVALPAGAERAAAADRSVAFADDPFSLGVASGDPSATSVVLWTKLAPDPLDPDGGMRPENVPVRWEMSDGEAFTKIVAHGQAVATPQLGHTVHVQAAGLAPDRWYWYRFRAGDATSPIGRTRTLPATDAMPAKLKFAFTSCQNYEQGLYTGYAHMAQDDLDLVVHLGDYIYEYPNKASKVRAHSGPKDRKIRSLAEYRERHMQYRADPLLHGMHAQCPWFVTWDDHDFENNYANTIQEETKIEADRVDPADFVVKRAAAYQAYYEMMPLGRRSLPRGPEMLLYRDASFGQLAKFLVLDTRQYRTDQPNGDGAKPLNELALARTNSLLGRRQRQWLDAALLSSTATWNVLAQQVMMAMAARVADGEEPKYSMDQWPGAAHERMEIVRFLSDRKVPNPVVLTGDIHSNWANELRVDDRQVETPVVAAEFVGTSLSSGGNGPQKIADLDKLLAANPCVKFHNRDRGYVRCTVTPERWTTDYVTLDDVLSPGGAARTCASFVVEAGVPGVKPA